MSEKAELSAVLEAALVRELRRLYEQLNERRFRDKLTPPVIMLSDTARRLGQWTRATRTLELSRSMVLTKPWLEVTSVLEHEMAHQYVDEILQIRDETAHGPTFARVCAERGIDARAAGVPLESTAEVEVDRALDKIRKLLALAGSENQNEAEIAMRRAHELMLRYNIENALTPEAAHAEQRYEVRHIGTPSLRANPVEADIVGLLSEFFFVEVIRIAIYLPHEGKHAHVYEVMGTHANVEMAVHVFQFLMATADRLWRENRTDARVKSGRDRFSYQSGVIRGFREKLLAERKELKGTGLVWVGDGALHDFYRARYPRIRTVKRSVRLSRAHAAGREAGRNVVLHKPVTETTSNGKPRLLRG
jgi:predicted SprT family Zn-dependent metalloprotease